MIFSARTLRKVTRDEQPVVEASGAAARVDQCILVMLAAEERAAAPVYAGAAPQRQRQRERQRLLGRGRQPSLAETRGAVYAI